MRMPQLGVVYWPELEPLLAEGCGLVDIIEIEPQAFWYEQFEAGGALRVDERLIDRLQELPQEKLVHSVGCPVGGSTPPDNRQLQLLQQLLEALSPAWITEHLSFNQVEGATGVEHALFLLPPLQTEAGVRTAIGSVREFASNMTCPVGIETGVNYLKPRPGELSDGQFIAAVADGADCGILLDLHNLLTNERNGRQSLRELVSEIPLHRVIEIHLAGGFEQDGYWLDAHSTETEDELLQFCQELIPWLPNLSAIIFEMLPSFIPKIGLARIENHLNRLRELLIHKDSASSAESGFLTSQPTTTKDNAAGKNQRVIRVEDWEQTLTELVRGRQPPGELAEQLKTDPGVLVLKRQIESFRRGMVVQVLPKTLRLLWLHQGDEVVEELFNQYWTNNTPQQFTSTEARQFAAFLKELHLNVPYLDDIVSIELAALRAQVERQSSIISISVEPLKLLRQLGEGKLPTNLEEGQFELEMTPNSDSDFDAISSYFGH